MSISGTARQSATLEVGGSVEGGETMHQLLATTLSTTVQFLIRNQSKDGSWGAWQNHSSGDATRPADATFVRSTPSMQAQLQFTPSGDAQRNPRVLSLLQWFDQRVAMGTDASVRKSIREYVAFVLCAQSDQPPELRDSCTRVARSAGQVRWARGS
jgi:hypothetical protein